MCKLQAHICNINFSLYDVIFDLSGRTFPAGCSWSQDMAGREELTGIRGGFSVGKPFLSTYYLLIPWSHATEEEDAKDSWQWDEFRVMLWPWGQAAMNTQFSCVLSEFMLGVKWVSSKRSQWEEKGQQPLLPVMALLPWLCSSWRGSAGCSGDPWGAPLCSM